MNIPHLQNLILNENAYFFKKTHPQKISKRFISSVFQNAASARTGNYLLKLVAQRVQKNNTTIYYSVCVFKYQHKPTFIHEHTEGWEETKLAYLVIVDCEDYVIISKKNVTNIQELTKRIIPIDYRVLSSLFIDEDTLFEKFSLNNMSISDNAIRNKSLEALDLKENFPAFGANSYILNSLRLKNNDEKISLSLNTSRINKFGKKNNILLFIDWVYALVQKIKQHQQKENYISMFAEPQDFEKEKDNLTPIATLFLFSKLYDDVENNRIEEFFYEKDGNQIPFNLISKLEKIERLRQVEVKTKNGTPIYLVKNPFSKDLELKINSKSITFKSEKLKTIKLKLDNGNSKCLIDYLNAKSSFLVNFENANLIYTNRKLFRDNRLLGSIDYFLEVFQPHHDLINVISEKGNFTSTTTQFSDYSLFNFVEGNFQDDSDFFICDDLGKEWADHIGLYDNKIAFYHSKHKETNFSASAFQDIIGQALKNLGNLNPADYQWPQKESFWAGNYVNGTETQIARLRKGNDIKDAINYFKKLTASPNLTQHVYLIINFISKSELQDRLQKLKNNQPFRERNEVIQILWYVSSLITSCRELGIGVFIYCKP